MARTCALIQLVQPALHLVSCSNETIQNAPKHYKTHKNISLGSNGVDQVRSLPKIPMRVRSLKFCVNCISSARFAPSFMQSRKNPKCTQILQNEPIHDFRVQWGRSGALVAKKFWCEFMAQTCALIAPVQPILHRVSRSNETLTNAPKHYENAPKHEFRVQWGGSRVFVAKNSDASSWHELLHYSTSSAYFASSFML